jgi:hypothetical protein
MDGAEAGRERPGTGPNLKEKRSAEKGFGRERLT